jgi:membrane-bound lytic murein transglycosylase D
MKSHPLRKTCATLLALLLILPFDMPAQSGARKLLTSRSRRVLEKENTELRTLVDSLLLQIQRYQEEIQMRDSIEKEMIGIYGENEGKSAAGLNPEDYSPELTDSLLSVWYLQRQVRESMEGENYDMDSLQLSSKVSDAVLKERLENMNSFITLPFNETVRNYMILYSEKMPERMSNILGLCQYYMPVFEETFNKYGLPDELKYLAVIESALNPLAVSRAGAKGMWQFMFQTAKAYGLEINSFVDERMDPFKSADAAARYLEESYRIFGDWNLAISSYNCGPGNVNKALRRNGGKRDFWSVYDYLPRETRGYVPAFVGAMYAIKYSKENGLFPENVQMPAEVDTFEIRRNLHFGQISELVGIPIETLRNLNPQYIQDIIPGNSGTYILRIPYNFTNDFIAHEDSVYTYKDSLYMNPRTLTAVRTASTSNNRITYRVRSGDYLGKIASRYNVTVSQLKEWNNLRGSMIRIGQRLYIYTSGGPAASSSAAQTSSGSSGGTSGTGSTTTYTVRSGDTLYGIAKRYPGVSADDIMKANGIGSKIHPGMQLKIPVK